MFINWALTNSLEGSLQRNSEELNLLSTSPSTVVFCVNGLTEDYRVSSPRRL